MNTSVPSLSLAEKLSSFEFPTALPSGAVPATPFADAALPPGVSRMPPPLGASKSTSAVGAGGAETMKTKLSCFCKKNIKYMVLVVIGLAVAGALFYKKKQSQKKKKADAATAAVSTPSSDSIATRLKKMAPPPLEPKVAPQPVQRARHRANVAKSPEPQDENFMAI